MDSPTDSTPKIQITLQNLFSTPEGEEALDWLCIVSGMFKSSYQGNPNDAIYADGAKSIVLRLLHMLNKEPQDMTKIMKKHYNIQKETMNERLNRK